MSENINKGIIVAGMHSSSGKTAVTSLVLAAMHKRGLSIQPFKIGPDYIDAGYHLHYSTINSVNLDPWIMGQDHVVQTARQLTKNSLGVAEGVMGLFDGSDPETDVGSTMEIARWLGWQILLVVPCQNAGRSITASIQGFVREAGGAKHFIGIILNQAKSESHVEYLRKACKSLEIPFLGALSEIPALSWPERYLGLQPGLEQKLPEPELLAVLAEKHLELDLLYKKFPFPNPPKNDQVQINQQFRKRIAVAQDEAFHFYYYVNLEWLRQKGAEVVPFSPLKDRQIPENVDGLILGGGFPEVFAEEMSANKSMLDSLKTFVESGLPCYAECGGLMVMAEGLKLLSGKSFPMAGIVPGFVEMTKQLQHFGYCKVELPNFGEIRGHEFHYSQWTYESKQANLWEVTRHSTGASRREGYRTSNLHASYVHLYFPQASSLIRKIFNLFPDEREGGVDWLIF